MRPQVYSPGAGHRPLVSPLPGRGQIREAWEETLVQSHVSGRQRVRDQVFQGLRGTGKTVLLGELCETAGERGFESVWLQSTRDQGIWSELARALDARAAERREPFWRTALEALRRVRGISVAGVGLDLNDPVAPAAPGVGRSSGHLAQLVAELAEAIRGERADGGGLVLAVDELQTAPPSDVELLGAALHQLNVLHADAPVLFVGAGLPNTRDAITGPDLDRPLITHPERLFEFTEIGSFLDPAAVTIALTEPVRRLKGSWTQGAVDLVREVTKGYPAHLQLVAAETWSAADRPVIDVAEVQAALPRAAEEIERQYLRPRWDRLSDRQREYVTALAVAGARATARQMQLLLEHSDARASSRVRQALIRRGEIYTPESRLVALAMPLMERYAIARYPTDRLRATRGDTLLTLEQLEANQAAWTAASATDRHPTRPVVDLLQQRPPLSPPGRRADPDHR